MKKSSSENNPRGVITALVTPFKKGSVAEIDEKSFVRLLHQQLAQGVEGFVINGTTAESPTLRADEVRRLFQIAQVEVAGSVPLIVGTGSNSTAHTIEFSREVCKWGPQALLVVVPYYNRPPQRGMLEHFRSVANASTVPIILYNVPSRTVANLEPQSVIELSRETNIIGIKEATGDMTVFEKIKTGVASGFTLLSGDDGSCVEFCARGGHGVISVSSHIIGAEMREYIAQGALGQAEYKTRYADLMKWLYIEANPIAVKMALHWMGVIDSAEMRLPLTTLDQKFHQDFKACLRKLEKIK